MDDILISSHENKQTESKKIYTKLIVSFGINYLIFIYPIYIYSESVLFRDDLKLLWDGVVLGTD